MGFNKKFFTTGGIVASAPSAPAALDPFQNFETVTYTGNGSTQKITGYIRKGAAFNGSSSVIDTPTTTGIKSVSMFVNVETFSQIHALLGHDTDTSYFLYISANNTIRLRAGGYSSTTDFTLSTSLQTNTWHHLLFVESSNTITVYLDGNSVATGSPNGLSGTNQIGGRQAGTDAYTKGKIDQVRFFNTAITDTSKINQLAIEDYSKATKSTTDIFGDGSGVALYELDEDASDTGGTYDGTPTNVNFLGMAFQPDFVWIKSRDNSRNHRALDSVRGGNKELYPNLINAEYTFAAISSFDSNGFTIGTSDPNYNANGEDYVAWCWKAADTTTNISASGSQVAAEVRANTAAGFSIVKYTFSSPSASQTVPHGLDSAPEMIITKSTTDTGNWYTYHKDVGTGKYLILNDSAAAATYANGFSTVDATAWQQYFRSDAQTHVAYCFHSVDGYQKVGYFNQVSGITTVSTGFKPRFLIIKRTDNTGDWIIFDSLRNNGDKALYANSSIEEQDTTGYTMAFNNDGFVLTVAAGSYDVDYIYLAIA